MMKSIANPDMHLEIEFPDTIGNLSSNLSLSANGKGFGACSPNLLLLFSGVFLALPTPSSLLEKAIKVFPRQFNAIETNTFRLIN